MILRGWARLSCCGKWNSWTTLGTSRNIHSAQLCWKLILWNYYIIHNIIAHIEHECMFYQLCLTLLAMETNCMQTNLLGTYPNNQGHRTATSSNNQTKSTKSTKRVRSFQVMPVLMNEPVGRDGFSERIWKWLWRWRAECTEGRSSRVPEEGGCMTEGSWSHGGEVSRGENKLDAGGGPDRRAGLLIVGNYGLFHI